MSYGFSEKDCQRINRVVKHVEGDANLTPGGRPRRYGDGELWAKITGIETDGTPALATGSYGWIACEPDGSGNPTENGTWGSADGTDENHARLFTADQFAPLSVKVGDIVRLYPARSQEYYTFNVPEVTQLRGHLDDSLTIDGTDTAVMSVDTFDGTSWTDTNINITVYGYGDGGAVISSGAKVIATKNFGFWFVTSADCDGS